MSASKLSNVDRAALRRAGSQGWLMLNPDLCDAALTVWQRECARARWPFAVVRPEPRRATMWLALPPGREWSDNEQQMVREDLADAAGVALYPTGMRAFLPLGSEQTVMPRLLALAFAASLGDHVAQVQRC